MEHDADEGETIIKVILNSRKGIFFISFYRKKY